MKDSLVLFIATAFQPDPPRAGIGVTLNRGGLTLRRVSQRAGAAGPDHCALMALIRGLEEVHKNHPQQLEIHTDSQWLAEQLRSEPAESQDRAIHEGLSRARQLLRGVRYWVVVDEMTGHPARQLARQALGTGNTQLSNFLDGPVKFGTQATAQAEALQESAGGVVYKREGGRIKVCLVSKRGGRIWALPKGRVDSGESHQQTAEREVLEETGHRTRAGEKLHEIEYYFFLKETQTLYHKYVYFFLMNLEEENARPRDGEADEVAWFELGEAYKRLSYLNEKQAVKKAQKILR